MRKIILRLIIAYIILIIIFGALFTFAFLSLNKGIALFALGMPPAVENWIVMILSTIALIGIVRELYML